jgi:tetratricopeptide (TPR) repeat protein
MTINLMTKRTNPRKEKYPGMRGQYFFYLSLAIMAVSSGCITGTGYPAIPLDPQDPATNGSFVMSGGKAIALSVKADEITTTSPEAKDWFLKGLTAASQHAQYHESLEYYDKALNLDPDFETAWIAKGVSLQNLNRYDEAIACYDRALALDPSNELVLSLKATAREDSDRQEDTVIPEQKPSGCTNTYPVPAGGTVYLGENCLDVSAAVSSGQVISWYTEGRNPGNDTPDAIRTVRNATNFFVNPDDFLDFEGNWYTGKGDIIAFVVKMPILDAQV